MATTEAIASSLGSASIRPLLIRIVLPTVVVFDRRREQDAAMNRFRESEIVRHRQVDDDLIQHRGLKSAGAQRSYQPASTGGRSRCFRLRNPGSRSLQRAYVLRVVALVDCILDLDADVFTLPGGNLQRIAPEVSLSLQAYRLLPFDALVSST